MCISCLTTSNLPWFMDWISRFLRSLALYSIRLYFPRWSHQQLGIVFALALSLHSFWSYFSTDLQQHVGHLLIWGVHLSVSYLFAFSCCSWGSRQECWSGLPFLSPVTTFCQNFPPDLSMLSGPTQHGSKFHWVRQGCGPCDQHRLESANVSYFYSVFETSLYQLLLKKDQAKRILMPKRGIFRGGKTCSHSFQRPILPNI